MSICSKGIHVSGDGRDLLLIETGAKKPCHQFHPSRVESDTYFYKLIHLALIDFLSCILNNVQVILYRLFGHFTVSP